ncbi:MAG: hypothetical protein ACRDV6_09575 [Acidimicrobiales bacterium]
MPRFIDTWNVAPNDRRVGASDVALTLPEGVDLRVTSRVGEDVEDLIGRGRDDPLDRDGVAGI